VLLFYEQQQMIFGGKFKLLRGFLINDEYAEFQKAELAGPQAEIAVAQKRQDLYLAGAMQYWDWQVAVKQAEVVKRALAVAEDRLVQVEGPGQGREGRAARCGRGEPRGAESARGRDRRATEGGV
jgi:hypothetical protein